MKEVLLSTSWKFENVSCLLLSEYLAAVVDDFGRVVLRNVCWPTVKLFMAGVFGPVAWHLFSVLIKCAPVDNYWCVQLSGLLCLNPGSR